MRRTQDAESGSDRMDGTPRMQDAWSGMVGELDALFAKLAALCPKKKHCYENAHRHHQAL